MRGNLRTGTAASYTLNTSFDRGLFNLSYERYSWLAGRISNWTFTSLMRKVVLSFLLCFFIVPQPDAYGSGNDCECLLTIQGRRVSFDEKTLFYYASGNAQACVSGQSADISADVIRYSDLDRIMDARGNVKITRNGVLTTGKAFRFRVNSRDYLITDDKSVVSAVKLTEGNEP